MFYSCAILYCTIGIDVKGEKNEKGYRGIYVTKDVLEDEMYMFQLKNSKAIFCNNSSLYLWNLTEKNTL